MTSKKLTVEELGQALYDAENHGNESNSHLISAIEGHIAVLEDESNDWQQNCRWAMAVAESREIDSMQASMLGPLRNELASAVARAAKLEIELRNFLSAFDGYFEMRGGMGASPQKAHDAKQAMFSAAIQARAALESPE